MKRGSVIPAPRWPSTALGSTVLAGALRRGAQLRAFSLIELLIAVGMIGMLTATLLPSLRSAREQARIAVCSSNTASIGRAGAAYSAEHHGWLCGSPGTSGSELLSLDPRPAPAEEEIAVDAVQIWDYAGPLAAGYMNMSIPDNRAERFRVLLEGVFHCPSNRYSADPYPRKIGSFDTQPMVSYNTFRSFMTWSRTTVRRDPDRPWGERAPHPEASFDRIGGHALQPKSYLPNLNRVVNPAGKAFLADGNRYTDRFGELTYDLEWDALHGGAFCNGGPTLREWNNGFILSAYHFDKRLGDYAYRHRRNGGRGIVVNYFDGHADYMTESDSRGPDTWWPKGTLIPSEEFNEPTATIVGDRVREDGVYLVGR